MNAPRVLNIVLRNSKLNLGIEMMFLLSFFFWTYHGLLFQTWSYRNLLMWMKKWYHMTSFLKSITSFVNFMIFRKMVIWRIPWSINTKCLLSNANDNKFFCVSNFDFGSLICSEVVANKSFSIGKPIRAQFCSGLRNFSATIRIQIIFFSKFLILRHNFLCYWTLSHRSKNSDQKFAWAGKRGNLPD